MSSETCTIYIIKTLYNILMAAIKKNCILLRSLMIGTYVFTVYIYMYIYIYLYIYIYIYIHIHIHIYHVFTLICLETMCLEC